MRSTVMVACQVVAEEMAGRLPGQLPIKVIDPSLHDSPDRLRTALQAAIKEVEATAKTILAGYGLCSRSIEGLKSNRARLAVPRVDDCIGIFLGSRAEHLRQNRTEPGTFFLSRGWVRVGSTPFSEYGYMAARFGEDRANRLMKELLKHYKRLVYICTATNWDGDVHRVYALETALLFHLHFEEIQGTDELTEGLVRGGVGRTLHCGSSG